MGRPRGRVRHKYGAIPAIVNGRRYASQKEGRYAAGLELRKQAGEVLFWLEQVPFRLQGGVKYVVDFQEFHADGSVHFVDVKGMQTPTFKLKRKQLAEAYPHVEIEIV